MNFPILQGVTAVKSKSIFRLLSDGPKGAKKNWKISAPSIWCCSLFSNLFSLRKIKRPRKCSSQRRWRLCLSNYWFSSVPGLRFSSHFWLNYLCCQPKCTITTATTMAALSLSKKEGRLWNENRDNDRNKLDRTVGCISSSNTPQIKFDPAWQCDTLDLVRGEHFLPEEIKYEN